MSTITVVIIIIMQAFHIHKCKLPPKVAEVRGYKVRLTNCITAKPELKVVGRQVGGRKLLERRCCRVEKVVAEGDLGENKVRNVFIPSETLVTESIKDQEAKRKV